MSKIQVVNEYTPVSVACYGWQKKPKPQPMKVKKQVRKNKRSTWAKGSVGTEEVYSGELLARMYEETNKDLDRQRFPDQEDFKKIEKRQGRRMQHTELIKKVLSLNKNLVYEDSKGFKGCGAFYLIQRGPDGGASKIYTNACFRKGWLPEWTTMETDAADLPTQDGLTYGWRTVLQRLVQKKAVTYRQVVKVFGDVYRNDLCGKNWALNVGKFRN